jgi:hypothetical protein
MPVLEELEPKTATLRDALRRFGMPRGEQNLRHVRGVKLTQRGEMRSSPDAAWMPFSAEEVLEAGRSEFRWRARFGAGRVRWIEVTDGYEQRRGSLVVRLAGLVPVARSTGPDVDRGELQRYLAEIVWCPPALLQHPSLEWWARDARTLRLRDREGPPEATVDLELAEDGLPLAVRGVRPRLVGKHTIDTPWAGSYHEPREWEGLRVPGRVEVRWLLAEGPFTYFKGEVTSLVLW